MKKIILLFLVLSFSVFKSFSQNEKKDDQITVQKNDSTNVLQSKSKVIMLSLLDDKVIDFMEVTKKFENKEILCSKIEDLRAAIFYYGEKARYGIMICITNKEEK